MNRAFPVLVAVLLICSPAVASESGMSSSSATTPNVTNPVQPPGFNNTAYHLSLGNPDRSDTYTPSLSLSTALQMDRSKLQAQKRMNTLDERLSNAKSNGEKRQILVRFSGNLSARLSAIQTKERTASQQFASQKIKTSRYVKDLALVETEADNVKSSMEYMKSEAEQEGVIRFSPNEWEFRTYLIPLQSRVRKSLVSDLQYETDPKPIYVATTSDGVVLSTVSGNQYIREAYRADYRNGSIHSNLDGSEKYSLTMSQYPWVNQTNTTSGTNLNYRRGVALTKIIHSQGLINAYLDSGTKKIYREVQYKYLTGDNHVPYGTAVRNNSTNLNLVVNRTYSGGPLRINLTDGSGDPVNGRIEVGNTPLGTTGKDGTIFTVSPSREFTVRATHDSETLKVTLTPYGVTNSSSGSGTPRGAGESS